MAGGCLPLPACWPALLTPRSSRRVSSCLQTYTMTGPLSEASDPSSPNRGIIPRFLQELFARVEQKQAAADDITVKVEVENLEIYCGQAQRCTDQPGAASGGAE